MVVWRRSAPLDGRCQAVGTVPPSMTYSVPVIDAARGEARGRGGMLIREFDRMDRGNHNDHMSKTVGAREFKTRLGTYLRRVQRGATLVVTDRGRPIAEVHPIRGVGDEDAGLGELVALGVLARASDTPLRRFDPIRVKGRSVSEVLAEDREDRI